jgi:hypothetical protein
MHQDNSSQFFGLIIWFIKTIINLSGCGSQSTTTNNKPLKNNLKQKLTPKSKPRRKNPIGKTTTTTKLRKAINTEKMFP